MTSVLFEAVHYKNMYILTGTFYGVFWIKEKQTTYSMVPVRMSGMRFGKDKMPSVRFGKDKRST